MAQVDHVEATRDRLLRIAGDLFARRGYAGVSMRDVARAAGVTKPALYYHFRDKDALVTECLLTEQAALGRRLVEAVDSVQTLVDQVAAAAAVLIASAGEHPARSRTDAGGSLPLEARARVDMGYATQVLTPLVGLFDDVAGASGLRAGMTPELAAAALVGICTGAPPEHPNTRAAGDPVTVLPGGQSAEPELARRFADLVLHGVVAG